MIGGPVAFTRILAIVQICLPVFGLIGLGIMLRRRRVLSAEQLPALNAIIYYLALPSLVFSAIIIQPYQRLLNPVLIVGTIVPTLVVAVLFYALTRLFRIKGSLAAVSISGAYWANTAYIGFPLAQNAFGADVGLGLAATVNAFAMPAFLYLSMFLIGAMAGTGRQSVAAAMKSAALNPVVLAAFLAIVIAVVRDTTGFMNHTGPLIALVSWSAHTVQALLTMLGSLGLPLALINVGASIRLGPIRDNKAALILSLIGKLAVMPLLTLLMITLAFPHADKAARGVAVLLMATPNAVASYVISNRMGIEGDFLSGLVAISTVLSIITIPIWLFFLL